ncbi:MAG TPA: glycosyltransferase [Allosphingosinicella sp.]
MSTDPAAQPRRLAFLATNTGWGGSEELWSAAAAVLAGDGHSVTILKANIDFGEPRIARLRELGCRFVDLRALPFVPARGLAWAVKHLWVLSYAVKALRLWWGLRGARPDLVILSQGHNSDGLFLGKRMQRFGLPYAMIMQKATELYWPYDDSVADLRDLYDGAKACWFVSEHNRRLTEEQLGMALDRASVVRNPFLVPWRREEGWPDDRNGIRLACVGRLFPAEKGQDLVLRVLARDKWRARPVSVTFFGSGKHEHALRRTAVHLGLESVDFAGFAREPAAIWSDHHGLLLPSRAEGLPLVLVEAMLCGRVPIVTDVAGASEVVTDSVNGFLASAPTEDRVDEAMERAWARRAEWRSIGDRAAADIRRLVPSDPARVMADLILEQAGALPAWAEPGRRAA